MPQIIRSPWGKVQHQTNCAEGIDFVSTAGHGGFKLNRARNNKIPKLFRRKSGWYEEDVESAIVFYFFCEVRFPFTQKTPQEIQQEAAKTLINWLWREWEAYTGTVIPEGQSSCKTDDLFNERNRTNFVVRTAWGDWHPKVPKGMVGVCATRQSDKCEKYFLVPQGEYGHGEHRFAIDLDRHHETINLADTQP